jgi:hypothetical protein
VQIWFGEVLPADRLPQVRREVDEALRLDPSPGSSWRVLAAVRHFFEWDPLFRRAMDRAPTDPAGFSWFGDHLLDMRRFDEAHVLPACPGGCATLARADRLCRQHALLRRGPGHRRVSAVLSMTTGGTATRSGSVAWVALPL